MTDTAARSRHQPEQLERAADGLLPLLAGMLGGSIGLFLRADTFEEQIVRYPIVFGCWFAGLLIPRGYYHRFRVLGMVPYAAILAAGIAGYSTWGSSWCRWGIGAFCLLEGIALGAVLRFRDRFRLDYRRFQLTALLGLVVLAVGVALGGLAREVLVQALPIGAILIALISTVGFLRPAAELPWEVPVRFMYKLSATGPGLKDFPLNGPVLVIANHAAWFDPLLLAYGVPRATTPMMTASFHDKPFLRPIVGGIVKAIRVPEIAARRDAPEIREAIEALDAGKCVVIFPEGFLRRKEEMLLKRFGQGLWHILQARPNTPVVACWIEGTWGSYMSHYKGPPTKNKPFDIRHPVAIGMSSPIVTPEGMLDEGLRTRIFFMNEVLGARKHLGLPEVPPYELPRHDDEAHEHTNPSDHSS